MTVLVEHDNGIRESSRVSGHAITKLEDLLPLIQSYIQAGSCVYKVTILPNREGESWT